MSSVEAYFRRRKIAERLGQYRGLRIADLLSELGCSYSTLTRDLKEMESDGLLRRVRGGIAPPAAPHGPPVEWAYRARVGRQDGPLGS